MLKIFGWNTSVNPPNVVYHSAIDTSDERETRRGQQSIIINCYGSERKIGNEKNEGNDGDDLDLDLDLFSDRDHSSDPRIDPRKRPEFANEGFGKSIKAYHSVFEIMADSYHFFISIIFAPLGFCGRITPEEGSETRKTRNYGRTGNGSPCIQI
jgi:hypothetical protein